MRNKYTDDTAVVNLNNSLNQEGVFNRLTDNRRTKGMFLINNELYLNATYINSGQISADKISGGTFIAGGTDDFNGEILVLGSNTSLGSSSGQTSATQYLGYSQTNALGEFTISADLSGLEDDITLVYQVFLTLNGSTFNKVDEGEFKPGSDTFKLTFPTRFDINTNSGNRYYYINVYEKTLTYAFTAQFSYARITSILDNGGIKTTQFSASGDCSFGNLKIGEKIISPAGVDVVTSYIYAEGSIEYLYRDGFSAPSTYYEYIYVCPAADGWINDGEVSLYFSADDTDYDDHDSYVLCRVDKQTWNGSEWHTTSFRKLNSSGNDVNNKDSYFDLMSASDTTVYRFKIRYVKTPSWSGNYEFEVWVDGETSRVHTLEIDPYASKGNFIGRHAGSGDFDVFKTGSWNYNKDVNVFNGHNTTLEVDDYDDENDRWYYKVSIGYNNMYKQTRGGQPVYVQWDTSSDERIKENIEPLDTVLSRQFIDNTQPKSFKYKKEDGKHYGMIAQEVRTLLDSLGQNDAKLEFEVDTPPEAEIKDLQSINYNEYIPHLINYVKELRAELDQAKAEIEALKTRGK